MKFLITFCFIASFAAIAWTSSASWGKRSNDFLINSENVLLTPLRDNYRSLNVDFPKSGQFNNRNITYIVVTDRCANNSCGQPSLWSGGPGFKFASINVKSQISQGINLTIQIFGR